jgi:hypothetical protein
MAAKESKETLRIRELEAELLDYKEKYDLLYEEHVQEHSVHVTEIEDSTSRLGEELVRTTSALLGVDTNGIFDSAEYFYNLFLMAQDTEFYEVPFNGADREYETDLLETLETQGESQFLDNVIKHDNTPAEYMQAKEFLSKLPNASSSKKPSSKSKKASRLNTKSRAREEKVLERRIAMNRAIIHTYELRERIRASPEAQAIIKKIIHDHTPLVLSIFKSPPKTPRVEQRLEECEAKAERYRKALRLSVGIPNDAVKAGGRRTVKRRRVTGTKA